MGEVDYILREIHEWCCGEHLGGIVLARKAMLAGFWWPNISQDFVPVVWACEGCQNHSNFHHRPATLMEPICASCPFDQWGMDIVGPFPISRAQKKFLLVAVDYFLKLQDKGKDWVEELPGVLWAYRTTHRAPTQEIHFNLVYDFEAVIPVEIGQTSARVEFYPDDNDQSRGMELDLVEEKREQALIRMEAYRGGVMKSYNKRVRIRYFQIGDLVIKKVNPVGDVGKLEARREGPFKIT
ncbi:uncharacterized protein LOC142523787 [Primulina tabacum]|uniref:uncharacterized protein LOC142523787 n=1 Tax=Primulina tabacum TaxID=48773 RepID=UPI003F592C7D